MKIQEVRKKRLVRRKYSIRKKISGTPERPRLTIYRSVNHVYAQIIDDTEGKTLVSASTLDKDIRDMVNAGMARTEKCKLIGSYIAKRALEKNIKKVAFDRNGYLYHGRIKALADAARESGLDF